MPEVRNNRVNERGISLQGNPMRIIAYRGCKDIDVLFENTGYIAYNKNYRDFKKGLIKDKSINTKKVNILASTRLGEIKYSKKYSTRMKIVNYRSSEDIDVCFEDNICKIYKTTYSKFTNDNVYRCDKVVLEGKSHIGECSTANNGMKMTIIDYRCSSDIDIKFEDNTIVRSKTYANFISGAISHPVKKVNNKAGGRVGEKRTLDNGEVIEIVAYRGCNDVDVKFLSDGSISNTSYYSFSHSNLRKPFNKDNYIRHTFNSWYIIDVDDELTNKVRYCTARCLECNKDYHPVLSYIVKGNSKACTSCSLSREKHKKWGTNYESPLGKKINSLIIKRRIGSDSWLLECEDCKETMVCSTEKINKFSESIKCPCALGLRYDNKNFNTIVEMYDYVKNKLGIKELGLANFTKHLRAGTLNEFLAQKDPDYERLRNAKEVRVGEYNVMNNGVGCEIIRYKSYTDLDVKFDDGTVIRNTLYDSFKNRGIGHSSLRLVASKVVKGSSFGSFNVYKLAYKLENPRDVFYICECRKCKHKDILNPEEMLKHKCKVKE